MHASNRPLQFIHRVGGRPEVTEGEILMKVQELVCGAKIKRVSTRRPHRLRAANMGKGPCVSIKFAPTGEVIEIEATKGLSMNQFDEAYDRAKQVVHHLGV